MFQHDYIGKTFKYNNFEFTQEILNKHTRTNKEC